MFDGIKLLYWLNDFEAWKQAVNIEFGCTVLDTGEVKGKVRTINGETQTTIAHRADFDTYKLTVKETTKIKINGKKLVSYLLILDGSLHKNHFGGANYLPFTWEDLQKEICHLENSLNLSPELARLVNLEIGVNIIVPFAVFPFLQKNLISYKGNSFNKYRPDKKGFCLGKYCELSQYSVKIYDKGKQNKLPENVMRFELRFLKMETLKQRGINDLTNLKDPIKVNGLLSLLLMAWDNVLLFDSSINLKKPEIKPKEREVLQQGSNPKFWEDLKDQDTRQFNYQRAKFKELVSLHGKGWNQIIRELIKKEWQNLFKNCTNLPCGKNPELSELTIKIKGKNVQIPKPVTIANNNEMQLNRKFPKPATITKPYKTLQDKTANEKTTTNNLKKRFCQSCGKDISQQKESSKNCSSKYVGEFAAHQCRNNSSNPRNNFKNKIIKLTSRGLLFDILPYFNQNLF